MFMFCTEPDKITTMMDGLDDLTGDEKKLLDDAVLAMSQNKQAIVVSQTWEAVNAHSLPPADQERRVASAVRRELGTAPAPSYQQRAGELARRLQG